MKKASARCAGLYAAAAPKAKASANSASAAPARERIGGGVMGDDEDFLNSEDLLRACFGLLFLFAIVAVVVLAVVQGR